MQQVSLYLVLLRLGMGWIFFWAFIDKLFGLGFATCRDVKTHVVDVMCEKAWIESGSPTLGFLKFAAKGPFADFYHSIAGHPIVDWLFMFGLAVVGTTLLLGIAMRLAAFFGALMLLLMYTAGFLPPENNPFVDDHIIYALLLLALAAGKAGQRWGLGRWWESSSLVRHYPILR